MRGSPAGGGGGVTSAGIATGGGEGEQHGDAEKCRGIATPRAAMTPPIAAPDIPPRLNNAWKADRIGRPTRCSSSTPCAFTLTSIAPMAAPNSVSAAPSATTSHANAGSTSVAAHASVETDATSRLPGTRDQPAGERHRHQRPDAEAGERAAERRRRQRERGLHLGQARDPRREREAEDEEQRADGHPRGPHGGRGRGVGDGAGIERGHADGHVG